MKKTLSVLLIFVMLLPTSLCVHAATLTNTSFSSAITISPGSSYSMSSEDMHVGSTYPDYYFKITLPYTGTFSVYYAAKCIYESSVASGLPGMLVYNSSPSLLAQESINIPSTPVKNKTYYSNTVREEWPAGTYYVVVDHAWLSAAKYTYTIYTSFQCSHKSTSSKITVEPTCSSTGKEMVTCRCGQSWTNTIATLPHTPAEEWVRVSEPTCAAAGEEQKACTVCGGVAEKRSVAKLPHAYGDWTTDTEPTCTKKAPAPACVRIAATSRPKA